MTLEPRKHRVGVFSVIGTSYGTTELKKRTCGHCKKRLAGTVHDGPRQQGLKHLCFECSEDAINARWPHVGLTPTGGGILSARELNDEKKQEWLTTPLRNRS
jgi:hypothetical protein